MLLDWDFQRSAEIRQHVSRLQEQSHEPIFIDCLDVLPWNGNRVLGSPDRERPGWLSK